jgi:hypothetical protein
MSVTYAMTLTLVVTGSLSIGLLLHAAFDILRRRPQG